MLNPLYLKVAQEVQGKNILVTGGTGSFGKVIVSNLLQFDPREIVIFSRDEDKQHNLINYYHNHEKKHKLRFVIGDVRDKERVMEITRNIDIIFHAAALKHVPYCEFHPYEAVKTNIVGAQNVKNAAISNNVAKVIAISTDKAVTPVNAMGMSKAIQEKIMISNSGREHNTTIAMVRYGNVIASRGSVIPFFLEKIQKKEQLSVTHKEMTRFLLTLQDAIDLVFYALINMKGGEIFVKKAPSCNVYELAKVIGEVFGKDKNYPINIIGVRPGEKIHETLVSESEMLRAKDEKEHYIIENYTKYFDPNSKTIFDPIEDKSLKNKILTEYNSKNTTLLSKEDIIELLETAGFKAP